MKTFIEIHCETKQELFAHLSVLRQQLKAKLKDTYDDDEPDNPLHVRDWNCYGEHDVFLTLDDKAEMSLPKHVIEVENKQLQS